MAGFAQHQGAFAAQGVSAFEGAAPQGDVIFQGGDEEVRRFYPREVEADTINAHFVGLDEFVVEIEGAQQEAVYLGRDVGAVAVPVEDVKL